MAIVRMGDAGNGAGDGLARRVGLKAAKHAAKKHPAKKHPGKKHAEKGAKHAGKKGPKKAAKHVSDERALRAGDSESSALTRAFHHLQRASAVISLLEHDSGGDLKWLLERGIEAYRAEAGGRGGGALGLLRAAEHLGMAGLYMARGDYRVEVPLADTGEVERLLKDLGPRLERLKRVENKDGRRLEAAARELLRRAGEEAGDAHLKYEWAMAADGICVALERVL